MEAQQVETLPAADPLGTEAQQRLLAARLQQTNAIGDFNGDGITDIAVADFVSDSILVMAGTGEGQFRLHTRLLSNGGPRSVIEADFQR